MCTVADCIFSLYTQHMVSIIAISFEFYKNGEGRAGWTMEDIGKYLFNINLTMNLVGNCSAYFSISGIGQLMC